MGKTKLAVMLALAGGVAQADVTLVGAMKEKALLSVNGAAPKVYPVGAALPDGSKLVAVQGGEATIEEGGKRYTVRLGEFAAAPQSGSGSGMVLSPDPLGHYTVMGEINGTPARMLVDTGASLVSIPGPLARQMGIDYRRKGQRAFSRTAGGTTEIWIVKLDRLRVGDYEFANVEAAVSDAGLPVILLGNSVLKRFDMKTEGGYLTLTKRY